MSIVLMDIDDVLMAHTKSPPKAKTHGYDDWRKIPQNLRTHDFMRGWISFGMLDTLRRAFETDDVFWLTTWELTAFTGEGPSSLVKAIALAGGPDLSAWKSLPLDLHEFHGYSLIDDSWWKHNVVYHLANNPVEPLLAGRELIWVDNELCLTKMDRADEMLTSAMRGKHGPSAFFLQGTEGRNPDGPKFGGSALSKFQVERFL